MGVELDPSLQRKNIDLVWEQIGNEWQEDGEIKLQEVHRVSLLENPKGTYHLGDLEKDERIILKWIVNK
jgi:hypothetical protein